MDYKNEIRKIYKEYCKEKNIKSSKTNLKDFIEFLEIDFYDWVRENLRQHFRDVLNKVEEI